MEKICELCLIKFTTNRKKRRFCSIKCSSRAPFPFKFSNCIECEKQFIVTADRKTFCCQDCYFKSQSKKFIHKICPKCNMSFQIEDWKVKKTNYCSKSCMYARESKVKYRKKAFENLPNQCSICIRGRGYLCVHHIDFNRSNNVLSNLSIICHACHLRVHALIKRSELPPLFCMKLMLETDLFKLDPNRFKQLLKHVKRGLISFSIDMNLIPYLQVDLDYSSASVAQGQKVIQETCSLSAWPVPKPSSQ